MSGTGTPVAAPDAAAPAQPAPGQAGERGKSRNMRQLLQLLRYLTPYKLQVGGAIVALVVAAGAVLAVGQAVRRVIDFGFGGGGSHGFLDEYFLALFGVVVVLALATFGRFYLVSWLGERVVADIRKAVYGHVLELSPAFFETTPNGEVLSRLTTDTTLIQTVIGSSASVALRNILLMLGGVVLMAITSLKLTLLVLLIVPLVVVPIIAFGRKLRRLSRTSQDRIADVSAFAGETLYAIQTVQAFTHETVDRQRFGHATEQAFSAAVQRIHVRAILTALVMLLVFGAVDAIMWIGGKDVLRHVMTPGELTQFVVYAVLVAGASGALSEVWGDLQRAAGAAERLLELLRAEPEVRVAAQPEPLPRPVQGAVTLQNVVFHYPARPETSALSDFSLAINPGETVALVGPSGAGKTTVFQLLQRFYDPEAGSITFDGVDIARVDPRALRARIGLVPQEPAIFAADAWENIRYGRPEASDAEVRAAADAAAASEFLDRLPDGFNAFLGERGLRLSGGQRQRIAIARAILRDPSLLLLDEATSALDAESERLVQQALEKLMVGRTTIVIAHRLATVLKANRIVVLDRGRLVAQGTHAELMAEGGLYARLARLQFDTGAAALATAASAD